MKLINQLEEKMKSLGGSLDEYERFFCLDAPPGYVWKATGCVTVNVQFSNGSETWLAKAIQAEMPTIKEGLELVKDQARLEEIQWDNGDEWKAPEDAPDKLEWPK